SLLSALTLTPMLSAFFLNVRHAGRRPVARPFPVPLGVAAGLLVAFAFTVLRLVGQAFPEASGLGWPGAGFHKPAAAGWRLAAWWAAAVLAEFAVPFLLVRYGQTLYSLADRYVLGPFLVTPTDWLMRLLTRVYAALLPLALRAWPAVLGVATA